MFFYIWVLLICWFVLIFLDTIFKSCMFNPYIRLLQAWGMTIWPFYISVYITRFNNAIYQMGNWNPPLIKKWFNLGVVVTAIILIPSIVICIASFWQMCQFAPLERYESSLLVPVIPGYNIPASHFLYYILIFLLCSAFHEFGHALAACREGVNLEDIGFTVIGIISYACVHFNADRIANLPRRRQLRIYCAGIWHNIFLTLVAVLLHWLLYIIFWPAFSTGSGVIVLNIQQESVFNHPGGLDVDDHLYKVGNCAFADQSSFRQCLGDIDGKPAQGFCVPDNPLFQKIYEVHRQKCLNFPEYRTFHTEKNMRRKGICLKARDVISYDSCSNTTECQKDFVCLYPVLEMFHRLVALHRYGKQPVIFEGPIGSILLEVDVSSYIPRLSVLSAHLPEFFALFLEYIIMFSSAIAVLNIIPSYYVDGAYIIACFVPLVLEGRVRQSTINWIVKWLQKAGLLILVTLLMAVSKVILLDFLSYLWWNL